MLMADGGSKLADQRAAIRDNKNISSRNDLEKIRIDWRPDRDIKRKLLCEFTRYRLSVIFTFVAATAGQLPFISRVFDQQNLSIYEQHSFNRCRIGHLVRSNEKEISHGNR